MQSKNYTLWEEKHKQVESNRFEAVQQPVCISTDLDLFRNNPQESIIQEDISSDVDAFYASLNKSNHSLSGNDFRSLFLPSQTYDLLGSKEISLAGNLGMTLPPYEHMQTEAQYLRFPDFGNPICYNESSQFYHNTKESSFQSPNFCLKLKSQKISGKHLTTKYVLPSSEENERKTHSSKTIVDDNSDNSVHEFCLRLIPSINKVTPQNYGEFLVGVLRDFSRDIPLDNFYKLLYSPDQTLNDLKENQVLPQEAQKGIQICSFIINTFRLPKEGTCLKAVDSINYPQLSSVNFEELLRTLFAIKVPFDLIEEVENEDPDLHTIPRTSIYNGYYEICHKLATSSKSETPELNFHRFLVIGKAQFGRITNLTYPKLKLRRLGRRGQSRPHYLGLAWNKAIVDNQMTQKLELMLLKPAIRSRKMITQDHNNQVEDKATLYTPRSSQNPFVGLSSRFPGSKYSFVSISSKFPVQKCSPIPTNYIGGKLPQHSGWFKNALYKSQRFLKNYSIDMRPVIQRFHRQVFSSRDSRVFVADFITQMRILVEASSEKEGYLHLYLIYLIQIFPIVLTSDDEVTLESKNRIRNRLNLFVTQINDEVSNFPKQELNHLLNFLNIIKKMIRISELSQAQIKTDLTNNITQEITKSFYDPVSIQSGSCMRSMIEAITIRAIIMASKAFNCTIVAPPEFGQDNSNFIVKVSSIFADFSCMAAKGLLEIRKSAVLHHTSLATDSFPFKIFETLLDLFHESFLLNPDIQKLPISIINFAIFQIHKETHSMSFNAFRNREHEISKQTFKAWWIHTALAEEYLQILGEILALGESL